MADIKHDPYDIPEVESPPKRISLRWLIGLGCVVLFAVHTLGMLYSIDAAVKASISSPENWKRADVYEWCMEVERRNPDFDCPSPYEDE